MALRPIYQMFAKLLSWIVLRTRSDTTKDVEILVLRHQLAVLQSGSRPDLYHYGVIMALQAVELRVRALDVVTKRGLDRR